MWDPGSLEPRRLSLKSMLFKSPAQLLGQVRIDIRREMGKEGEYVRSAQDRAQEINIRFAKALLQEAQNLDTHFWDFSPRGCQLFFRRREAGSGEETTPRRQSSRTWDPTA